MNKTAIEQLKKINEQINQTITTLKEDTSSSSYTDEEFNHLNSLCNDLATKNSVLQDQNEQLKEINSNLKLQLEIADKESQTVQYFESLVSKLDQEKTDLTEANEKLKQENDKLKKEANDLESTSTEMKQFENSISAVIRLFDHIPINSKTFSDMYSILSLHKDEDPIYPYLLDRLKIVEKKSKESAFRQKMESDPLMSRFLDIINKNDNELFWL